MQKTTLIPLAANALCAKTGGLCAALLLLCAGIGYARKNVAHAPEPVPYAPPAIYHEKRVQVSIEIPPRKKRKRDNLMENLIWTIPFFILEGENRRKCYKSIDQGCWRRESTGKWRGYGFVRQPYARKLAVYAPPVFSYARKHGVNAPKNSVHARKTPVYAPAPTARFRYTP